MSKPDSPDSTPIEGAALSRRELLSHSVRKGLGFLVSSVPAFALADLDEVQPRQWYEVVQDMMNPGYWHVNLYQARNAGDLERGRLCRHDYVAAEEFKSLLDTMGCPARIHFLRGATYRVGM